MPDNTLQFQTRVDLSGLNSGVAAASAAVSKFGSDTKASMSAAAIATNQLADAQKQLGAAAAQGNAQAQAIIAEYQAAVEAATPAVRNLAAVEEVEGGAVRHAMSDRMVANVALREMSMNFGNANRAAAAFLTTIPGIGAALQVAFPVFGAIALIEVLGQMAEKVHKIYDEYVNLRSIQDAYHKQLLEDGADEVHSSEEFLQSLRRRDVLTAELASNKAGRANAGQAAGSRFDITQDKIAVQEYSDDIRVLSQRMKELDAAQKPVFAVSSRGVPYQTNAEDAKRSALLYQEAASGVAKYAGDLRAAQAKLTDDTDAEKLRQREEGEKDEGAFEREQQKRLKAMEAEYSQAVLIGNNSLAYEQTFWAARLNLFAVGSNQYDAILQKLAHSAEENARKVHEALELFKAGDTVKANDLLTGAKTPKVDEGATVGLEGQAAALNMVHEAALKAAEAMQKLNLENAHEKAAGAIEIKETKVQAGAAIGITDPTKELTMLRDLHQQAIAEDEKFIQDQMALLQQQATAEQALYASDGDKVRSIQERLDNELLQLSKKLQADQEKGQKQELQDTERILEQMAQKYKQVYDTITTDFNSTINKLITTTESPAKAFAKMLDDMISQLATFVLKYLEKKAEMWILDKVLGKTAASSAALTQITTDAAVAGAGAYAATAPIPFVGPELAPAAAASAYSATLAFLSLSQFEKGGIVGGMSGMPVPIMAHAGERVLTTQQTQNFERVANSTSNHRAVNIHYNPSINAYDRSGMKQTLTAERDTILSIVRQGINSGALRR